MIQPHSQTRLDELDALRGLAALSVVFSHHLAVLEDTSSASPYASLSRGILFAKYLPTYPAYAGWESVILFFMLSGFVLTLPWLSRRNDPYPIFVARRLCRIYIPYLAAVGIAILASIQFYRGPNADLGRWFNAYWSSPISTSAIIDHVMMIGHFWSGQFNPVLWSLVEEMRISLAFPIVAFIVIRFSRSHALLSALAFTAIRIGAGALVKNEVLLGVLTTLHYTGIFVIGGLLARNFEEALAWYRARTPGQRLAFAAACWLGYAYGRGAMHFVPYTADWIVASAAGGIFVIATAELRARSFLNSYPVRALGRMSYSLYLFHAIVLLSALHLLRGVLPLGLTLLVSLVVGLISAYVAYSLIEVPAMNLGRLIARRALRKARDAARS